MGQLAVYPGKGVGEIEGIESQTIAGEELEVLVLRMVEDDARILIPRDRVDRVGLRPVIGRTEAARIWDVLRRRTPRGPRAQPWSRQFRLYQDKLKTGSIEDVAEVLRDLLRLQAEKELSFWERRVLDMARSLIVQELAAAQRTDTDRIEEELRQIVHS